MTELNDLWGSTLASVTFNPTERVLVITARLVDGGVATSCVLRLEGVSELHADRPDDSEPWIYTEIAEARALSTARGIVLTLVFWTEPHCLTATCASYRVDTSSGTKTPAHLDDMVSHIRYEVVKLMSFLELGNVWVQQIQGLPEQRGAFASQSMLEAALIHTRCVAEFLRHTGEPVDTITARDYVPGWHWVKGERLKADLAEIHGRVAHLGMVRRSVQGGGDFRWDTFLRSTAVPTLLDGFREFLGRLDDDLVERFNQPRPDAPRIDLVADITAMIGP